LNAAVRLVSDTKKKFDRALWSVTALGMSIFFGSTCPRISSTVTISEISVTEMITETKIIDPTLTETETEMMVILKTEIL